MIGRWYTVRSVLADGWRSVAERPGRSTAQALAVAIAVGCGVATVGVSATGAGAIDDQQSLLKATSMVVLPVRRGDVAPRLTDSDAERVGRLPGVKSAGLLTTSSQSVAVRSGRFTSATRSVKVTTLSAATLGLLGGEMADGTGVGQASSGGGTALLGARAAEDLGITSASLDRPATLVVGGRLVDVVGIVRKFDRRPDLGRHVVVIGAAASLGTDAATQDGTVDQSIELAIVPGAAATLESEIPVTVFPDAPDDVVVNSVPELAALGEALSSTTQSVMWTLGLVGGGLAAMAIASSTNAQVIRRRPEFALRRVFGASGSRIGALVAVETALVCAAGGACGGWFGTVIVAGVSLAKGWVPVMSPLVPLGGALVGPAIGLLAAAWPAYRAMSVEPRVALSND